MTKNKPNGHGLFFNTICDVCKVPTVYLTDRDEPIDNGVRRWMRCPECGREYHQEHGRGGTGGG
jgi:hypothetical protein